VWSLSLAGLLLVAGCGLSPSEKLERAKQSYVSGLYASAMGDFDDVRRREPQNPEAAHGYARSAEALHLYEDAIPAYEEAVKLDPEDGAIRENLTRALAWGGILKGDRRLLERALDEGRAGLVVAPERPGIYEQIMTAAGELQDLERYGTILERVKERHPDSPILEIKQWELALRQAQGSGDEDHIEAQQVKLGELLAGWEAELEGAEIPDAPQLYRIATAHTLLNNSDLADVAISRLDQAPGGRRLASSLVYWEQVMPAYIESRQEDDPVQTVETVQAWKPRFEPNWEEGGSKYRVLTKWQFEALADIARKQAEQAGDFSEQPALSQGLIDSLVESGLALIRVDTWRRADNFSRLAGVLTDLQVNTEDAIRLTTQALRAIEEDQPALFYPGSTGRELDEERTTSRAGLHMLRARALNQVGSPRDAIRELEEAAGIQQRPEIFADLGRLQEEQGMTGEAYESYVAALAGAEGRAQEEWVEALRADVTRLARLLGREPGSVDRDLTERREAFRSERIRRMVDDPLDMEAPDFELTDLAGTTWRLSDLQGKVVIINYWATWCGPCQEELPHFQQLVDEYADRDDLVFLAISTDEVPGVAGPWLEERGLTLTVLQDSGSAVDYNVTGVPTTIFIGREGRIQYREVGFAGTGIYLDMMRLRIEALSR
jgi:peroxiredoxin